MCRYICITCATAVDSCPCCSALAVHISVLHIRIARFAQSVTTVIYQDNTGDWMTTVLDGIMCTCALKHMASWKLFEAFPLFFPPLGKQVYGRSFHRWHRSYLIGLDRLQSETCCSSHQRQRYKKFIFPYSLLYVNEHEVMIYLQLLIGWTADVTEISALCAARTEHMAAVRACELAPIDSLLLYALVMLWYHPRTTPEHWWDLFYGNTTSPETSMMKTWAYLHPTQSWPFVAIDRQIRNY